MSLIDQQLELALAGNRVVEVQAGKFVLLRLGGHRQIFNKPVVQWTMIFKLQCTDRMGYPFDRIGLPVRKVIGRIDTPLVPGLMVMRMADAVDNRITHVHVGRRHIDLGTQRTLALLKVAVARSEERREGTYTSDYGISIGLY